MDFVRQLLFDWNERVAAATEYNSRMTQLVVASMATRQISTLSTTTTSWTTTSAAYV